MTSTVTTWSALIGEMVFALLGAVGMFFASVGYLREKSFGRSPAVLANLIALGVSYFMITGKFYLVGIPLALLAVTTIFCAIKGYKES
jgi:dolichyl-phosphate-mannose--protein O-mannosyl transferase